MIKIVLSALIWIAVTSQPNGGHTSTKEQTFIDLSILLSDFNLAEFLGMIGNLPEDGNPSSKNFNKLNIVQNTSKKSEGAVLTDSKSENSVLTSSKSEKSIMTDQNSGKAVLTGSKSEKSVLTDQNSGKAVLTGSEQEKSVLTGSEQEKAVSIDSKSEKALLPDSTSDIGKRSISETQTKEAAEKSDNQLLNTTKDEPSLTQQDQQMFFEEYVVINPQILIDLLMSDLNQNLTQSIEFLVRTPIATPQQPQNINQHDYQSQLQSSQDQITQQTSYLKQLQDLGHQQQFLQLAKSVLEQGMYNKKLSLISDLTMDLSTLKHYLGKQADGQAQMECDWNQAIICSSQQYAVPSGQPQANIQPLFQCLSTHCTGAGQQAQSKVVQPANQTEIAQYFNLSQIDVASMYDQQGLTELYEQQKQQGSQFKSMMQKLDQQVQTIQYLTDQLNQSSVLGEFESTKQQLESYKNETQLAQQNQSQPSQPSVVEEIKSNFSSHHPQQDLQILNTQVQQYLNESAQGQPDNVLLQVLKDKQKALVNQIDMFEQNYNILQIKFRYIYLKEHQISHPVQSLNLTQDLKLITDKLNSTTHTDCNQTCVNEAAALFTQKPVGGNGNSNSNGNGNSNGQESNFEEHSEHLYDILNHCLCFQVSHTQQSAEESQVQIKQASTEAIAPLGWYSGNVNMQRDSLLMELVFGPIIMLVTCGIMMYFGLMVFDKHHCMNAMWSKVRSVVWQEEGAYSDHRYYKFGDQKLV